MNEKCFCHLNGFAVKDSTARKMIESLQEINTVTGEKLKFFIGTLEEYEGLSVNQKKNLFAIITDDKTKEEILESINSVNEKVENNKEEILESINSVNEKVENNTERLSKVEREKAHFNNSFIESHDDIYPWLTKGEMYQVMVSIHDGESYLNSEIIAEFNGYNTHISLGNVIGPDGSLIFYRFFVGSGSGEVRVQKMKWKSLTDYTNWTELTYASQVNIYTRPIG